MINKMEWSFWLPTLGGALLTVIGVALATWSAISSHYDSISDKAKADSIALEHKLLLQQNYQKSLNIIEELNASSEKTKILLDNTTESLTAQKHATDLLSIQLEESSKINTSIQKSGTEVLETVRIATKNLDDNITGGQGFCHINIVNAGLGKFRLSAINNSKNNLPNVIIRVENYSELEKCETKIIDGVRRISNECFLSNSVLTPERVYIVGTNYYIEGDQYLDLSGTQKKIAVSIYTPKNMFYVQMFYKIEIPTKINVIYRVLKKVDGKYIPIESNDDHSDPLNPARWDVAFSIPPEMSIY